MKSAAECKDPLERFKITLSCLIAQPYYLNMFLKPVIVYFISVKPSLGLNSPGEFVRWYKGIRIADFSPPSNQLLLDYRA
jgi:hypothetical protein